MDLYFSFYYLRGNLFGRHLFYYLLRYRNVQNNFSDYPFFSVGMSFRHRPSEYGKCLVSIRNSAVYRNNLAAADLFQHEKITHFEIKIFDNESDLFFIQVLEIDPETVSIPRIHWSEKISNILFIDRRDLTKNWSKQINIQ